MEQQIEEWREIKGYEGLYEVSNLGRVRRLDGIVNTDIKNVSKRFLKGRILKPSTNSNGYYRVILSKDSKTKMHFIHRLVAVAFLPNPDNLPCVNHKDENPKNNSVWNLEWCTQKYNMNYGTVRERMSKSKIICWKNKKISK